MSILISPVLTLAACLILVMAVVIYEQCGGTESLLITLISKMSALGCAVAVLWFCVNLLRLAWRNIL